VPLLNGFLSKEMFFAEALAVGHPGGLQWLAPAAALLYGALSVGYSARFVMEVFFNADGVPLPRAPHEPPRFMRLPVELLVGLCILVGVAPALLVGPLLAAATRDALQAAPPYVSLAVWHGLNLPLGMTVVALAVGVLIYRHREWLYRWHTGWAPRARAATVYDALATRAMRGAAALTRRVESGALQRSLVVLLATALVLGGTVAWGARGGGAAAGGAAIAAPAAPGADAASVVVWTLLVASALATVRWHRDRLTALIGTSAVGLFVALAFVRLAAPDLALTQLLVEVVTIILLLLALHHLPADAVAPAASAAPGGDAARRLRAARDVVLAGGVGIGGAALAWTVLRRAPYGGGATSEVAAYYLERSKPAGGGTNAVNVTLVDFRGFDTLGEIAVLACAGLAAAVLLERMRPAPAEPARARDPDRHPLLLAMLARPFLPLALVLAAFLFVRGHDLPGGGFVAGLVAAVALASQYLTSGIAWTQARLRLDPRRWLAGGVLLALATGLGALVAGRPFLTSVYGYLPLPLVGDVGLGSAFLFDAGVLAAVLGAVLLTLERLGLVGVARALDARTPAGDDAEQPPAREAA
ncbi:MAG TPA: hydrogen gas-evolving membrane-bound hydrogenase subunit E, partial [Gemmatirosa sp.]|nr:hydrogen gas-evolving membrane-bound hydrogenase subunit E [Gemmatirosa sp.]